MELLFTGSHARQWYNLASVFGVTIVLAVISMHAVPIGILSRDTHAGTTQTTGSPFSYAEFPGQLQSLAQLHGKLDSLSGPSTFWKLGFPRSGATTSDVFIINVSKAVSSGSYFDAAGCEIYDVARGFHSCGEEMHAILQCDFSKYTSNHWWGRPWYSSGYEVTSCCTDEPYSPAAATRRCSEALVRNFGTLLEPNLDQVIPNLISIPALRVINQVRDPRGMYQSLKTWSIDVQATNWYGNEPEKMDHGFAGQEWLQLNVFFSFSTDNPDHLRLVCGQLAKMKNASHPRMLHYRFEDLISTMDVAKDILSLLGFPWTTDVEHLYKNIYPGLNASFTWAHFNHYPGNPGYTWTKKELAALYDVECQLAIANWAYPLT